jgi:hypothetical protein
LGCGVGITDGLSVQGTPEQFNEYTNLNISPTQIWSATWASGTTFNVTLIPVINGNFGIDFLGQCINLNLLTQPVILTTTI